MADLALGILFLVVAFFLVGFMRVLSAAWTTKQATGFWPHETKMSKRYYDNILKDLP